MKKPECGTRLGEKVCELYHFLCELCDDTGHFNFQWSGPNSHLSNRMSTASLFLECEEISRKTSLVDMSVLY
jgi:hypothetical protein